MVACFFKKLFTLLTTSTRNCDSLNGSSGSPNLNMSFKKFIAKFGTLNSESAVIAKSQSINKQILSNNSII